MVRQDSTDVPIYLVDAFAKDAFGGNPAAVCLLRSDTDISDETKQRIAAEMNQPITAFVCCPMSPTEMLTHGPVDKFGLRWFTPTMELELCGHATLASAAVVFKLYGDFLQEIIFNTKSGIHSATLKDTGTIALIFPLNPGQSLDETSRTQIQLLIDVCNSICGSPDSVMDVVHSPGTRNLLVRLQDNVDLANLSVDPSRFSIAFRSKTLKLNGIILTVKGPPKNAGKNTVDFDFVSRYFGPWIGIPEDHVCGSAHTVLAPYWRDILGRDVNNAQQVSRRGAHLQLDITSDSKIQISGNCKIVMKGHLMI